jgi:peptidyl-prolyl cis-trans isomerase D
VVQSDFGFHIIKLAGVKAEQVRPFEDVRNELAAELKKAEAGRKFAELAEGFTNMVYEQATASSPLRRSTSLRFRPVAGLREMARRLRPSTTKSLSRPCFPMTH